MAVPASLTPLIPARLSSTAATAASSGNLRQVLVVGLVALASVAATLSLPVQAADPAAPAGAASSPQRGGPGAERDHRGGPREHRDHRGGHRGHPGGPDGPGFPGLMMGRELRGLNLSEAQRSQIKQIRDAAAADMKTRRDAGRDLHEKAMAVFTAPTVDAAAAENLRQQMLAEHDQMSRRMLQATLDVSKVLTPEQRAKLAERMKQRAERMKDGGGPRAERGERGPRGEGPGPGHRPSRPAPPASAPAN